MELRNTIDVFVLAIQERIVVVVNFGFHFGG